MLALATAAQRYLQEVLAIDAPAAKPWPRASELPYFLRDAFQFSELELLGQPVVLAIGRGQAKQSLSDVRTWLSKVKAMAGQPAIYVTDALASYDRRRLIEQRVPFLVPGNQLYLPDLGIDLREHFRQAAPAADAALSPSAQAMLITALLRRPWQSDWQPSQVAEALGYTPMTLSRAVKEITAAGLATAYTMGRSRWLRMELAAPQLWDRARPAMRTPVRRTAWADASGSRLPRTSRIAGLSALARHSMLAEPKWPVFATTAADWKAALNSGLRELPNPEAGAQEWQLWNYSPALVPDADTVDPLSLMLSVEDMADDRIQLALDELKEQLPW